MRNPYEVLGVSKYATTDEIHEAYRRLCLQYHPDRHHDNPLQDLAEERLRELNEAYETLSDPQQRAEYNRTGGSGAHSSGSSSLGAEIQRVAEMAASRQFTTALSEVDRLIEMHRSEAPLYYLRGNILAELERWPEASKAYGRATQLDPANADCLGQYGMSLSVINAHEDAVEMLERARARGGDRPDWMAMQALSLEQLGRQDEARILLERVRAEDPGNSILQARDRNWKVGRSYVDKDEARGNACCLCLLLECIFDCI